MQISSNTTPFVKYWGLAFSLVIFPVGLSITRTPDLLILLWTVSLPFIMWWLWSFKEIASMEIALLLVIISEQLLSHFRT